MPREEAGRPVSVFALETMSGIETEGVAGNVEEKSAADSRSIAVIPFVDMSPAKDQEYFCEGMAEEILNALTGIPNLHVAARSSAFRFKGSEHDLREVGRALEVNTVLEGSVPHLGQAFTSDGATQPRGWRLSDLVAALRPGVRRRLCHSRRDRLGHRPGAQARARSYLSPR